MINFFSFIFVIIAIIMIGGLILWFIIALKEFADNKILLTINFVIMFIVIIVVVVIMFLMLSKFPSDIF